MIKIGKELKKKELCGIEKCSKIARYNIDLEQESLISSIAGIKGIDSINACSKRHIKKILKMYRKKCPHNTFEIVRIESIEDSKQLKLTKTVKIKEKIRRAKKDGKSFNMCV